MPADSAQSDCESHRLLRILAERLNQHGMRTREYRHGREVVEIAATNPNDPDKGGHVVIGFEGYIVREYWTPFDRAAPIKPSDGQRRHRLPRARIDYNASNAANASATVPSRLHRRTLRI
jgi:hypothetical protein